MQGLDLANQVMNPDMRQVLNERIAAEAIQLATTDSVKVDVVPAAPAVRSSAVKADEPIRVPPDLERHKVEIPDLRALWPYVSPFMLYGKHLGVKGNLEKLAEARDPKYLEIQEIVQRVQKDFEAGGMKARGVYQYFKANSDGNLLRIYDKAGKEIERFDFPRQAKADGLCLSDFVRPVGGDPDYVCLFVTTTGEGIRLKAEEHKKKGEYVLSHTVQAVAIEAAEGFAEKLHRDIRTWWGFPDAPELTMNDRFKARYQGIRVSFGYPACPNLADQRKLFALLKPEEVGVQLTEGDMMDPEASVSALVLHHSQAEYFSVGPEAAPPA
jgi:5-methyltetrahydrofolate--homocysteine methyltransferase